MFFDNVPYKIKFLRIFTVFTSFTHREWDKQARILAVTFYTFIQEIQELFILIK